MNVSNNKNKMKKKFLTMALFLSMLSAITMQTAFADNTTATATLGGNNTVTGSDAWANGLLLIGSVSPTAAGSAIWANTGEPFSSSYIVFVDNNSAADGAYLSIRMNSNKYIYTGTGVGNTGFVLATATYIVPNLPLSSPTKGVNDSTKNLNVYSTESCADALDTTKYLFHSNMRTGLLQLGLGTPNQILFRILPTSECTSSVKLGFRRVKINYPALTTAGSYTNTIVLTATDGTP